MKADAARLRAALASPPADLRLILLHGPDEAGARLHAETLAKALGPDVERIDLTPAQLRSTPALLADEAASLSLFGGTRYVRVTGAGEEVLPALTLLLAAERAGNPVLILAPTVKTTAKIVKLAIESRHSLSYACYEPSAGEADRLVTDLAQQAGLQPDRGVARRIAEASGNDRAIMAREIEKLALFLDASPDVPKPLRHEDVDDVGADLSDADSDAFAGAVVAGSVADVGDLLVQLNESGQSAIPWLRALSRRLMMLAELRRESDSGGDLSGALRRHRVHFTQEAAVRASLSHWPSPRIAAALDAVRQAERAIMAPNTAGDVIARAATLDMARRIARL